MRRPLTVEWEDVGKTAGNLFLKFLEYCFKLFALLAAGIAMATPGQFSEKLGASFSGLSQALRQTAALPGDLMEMGRIIQDYNVQAPSDFTATHGTGAVENLLFDLNRVVEYAASVYVNITGSFFATVGAAFLAFMAFYILATVLRFARQKGQGSYLVQLERKLGDRIFFKKPATAVFSSTTPDSISQSSKTVKTSPSHMQSRTGFASSPSSPMKGRASGPHPGPASASSKTHSRPTSKPDDKKRKATGGEDFAADSQTLSLILESARASD